VLGLNRSLLQIRQPWKRRTLARAPRGLGLLDSTLLAPTNALLQKIDEVP
jgi:hypothetical protein